MVAEDEGFLADGVEEGLRGFDDVVGAGGDDG